MTIIEALRWAQPLLAESCERPLLEVELLLAYHLKKERLYLHIHENDTVDNFASFQRLIMRRKNHEPYEYIIQEASFYDLHLYVVPGVLIPRPETELLIDQVSVVVAKEGISSIVEIGVGSGAISIVLARKFPQLQIIATDISDTALSLAQRNIDRYGVGKQITLVKSNLMDAVEMTAQMVVSNPPYIAADFVLEKNVFDYEPHTALFGGKVGDELLRQIVLDSHKRGVRWLACEMGYDQKKAIERFIKEVGVQYSDFYQDLAGFDRGFVARFA